MDVEIPVDSTKTNVTLKCMGISRHLLCNFNTWEQISQKVLSTIVSTPKGNCLSSRIPSEK